MCDFKPGDEVVCIQSGMFCTEKGATYVVDDVFINHRGEFVLLLVGEWNGHKYDGPFWGHKPERFRKVQRRNLTEWLSQKTKFEEPKHIGENA